MDKRRHIELQLRAIVVTYSTERRRQDEATMRAFRDRAEDILAALEERARAYPALHSRVIDLRETLADNATSVRRARGEQPLNGGGEVGDIKRFA